jgi:agmatine deiminase
MGDTRLPAEWESQAGVQLTWPHPDTDWGDDLDIVEPCFVDIACAISRHEKVLVVAHDQGHVRELLRLSGACDANVRITEAPSNDSWARDHAPITVLEDGQPLLLDFTFNGWGRKFSAELDNAISRRLHSGGVFGDTPMRSFDFVLEGGAIESDGAGTLLTTRQCLMTPTRNPAFDCPGIEAALRGYLGVKRVLWLTSGYLEGDDTDSHIDTLARFCSADTIAYVGCDRREDPHYEALHAMERELQALRRANGEPYRLVRLPLPSPHHDPTGQRLPATYANFLIINGAVLAPIYGDTHDAVALAQLTAAFPNRQLIPIDCRPLILQHGSLHCVTMQYPKGVAL